MVAAVSFGRHSAAIADEARYERAKRLLAFEAKPREPIAPEIFRR
jgi:hypothetical protein